MRLKRGSASALMPQPAASPARQQEKRWCGREDSNFHALRHSDLNAARLPIPPRPHIMVGPRRGEARERLANDLRALKRYNGREPLPAFQLVLRIFRVTATDRRPSSIRTSPSAISTLLA